MVFFENVCFFLGACRYWRGRGLASSGLTREFRFSFRVPILKNVIFYVPGSQLFSFLFLIG